MDSIYNQSESANKIADKMMEASNQLLHKAIIDPELIEFLRKKICTTANNILTANPEWKQIRKNSNGKNIAHRFTNVTNWQITVDEENLRYQFKNITKPSPSIFAEEKFGYQTQYNYDPNKDPYDGSALAEWIDRGLWIDATKLFEEMARANRSGKINADEASLRRSRIPFSEETEKRIAQDTTIKQAITNAVNRNR